jgi:molecular chaperone DnaJ
MAKDYYKVLGIEKNATQDEIKKAFKKLAMQYHPDRPAGDEKKFKEINEAFQVLGDAEKRTKYDQFGADFDTQGGFGGGMNWEDFMQAARSGGGAGGFGGFDFGDIFGDIFGFSSHGPGNRARQNRGRDIQVDLEISFEEAAFGVEKEVNLRKQAKCDVCKGSGSEPGSKIDTCASCHGKGQVVQQQRTFLGMMQTVITCPVCRGRGEKPSVKCKHCGGDGILSKTSNIKIKIPAGIDDGEAIRLSGHGEAAPHGTESGDLYVRIHVKSQKVYHREGSDVYTESEISFAQAVLGDKIEVPTLDGNLMVAVPEGVESGQLIRLKGRGIAQLGRSGRGDHYVRIKIRVPKKLSKEVRKKLDDLRKDL